VLAQTHTPDQLESVLLGRDAWRPYAAAVERAPWEALPESVRQAHIVRGEARLEYDWPSLPATLFLDYARTGTRQRYERASFGRRGALADLVMAECMEAKGRFLDAIANGVWVICEETYWGIPAHVGVQKAGTGLPDVDEPTVDLFAAETASLLAWTAYLLGPELDEVSPLIGPRIEVETQRRILIPCLERDDFWWMGFDGRRVNNWNPWINSNWLTAVLLLEDDERRRIDSVAKIMRSLDQFIDPYPSDGGCDEGPSYWGRAGASLFDCLELLHSATAGAVDVFDEPLIQDMGRFIYRVQISDRYFVNFADAPALVSPSACLVFRYGRCIGDRDMMRLGAYAAQQQDLRHRGVQDSLARQLPAVFALDELQTHDPTQPLPRDVWLPEIQVMTARDQEGSNQGLYVAAKGGHNAESHNHNDIGTFVLYVDGRPVIVDAGVETYTAKTFSSQRYELWTMQSAFHSLPTIGGTMQAEGLEHAASDASYSCDEGGARLRLDIAGAYPPQAGLRSWRRNVALHRGRELVVEDAYELESATDELTLSLLTPCTVALSESGKGSIALGTAPLSEDREAGSAALTWEGDLVPTVEEVPLSDGQLQQAWGQQLWRILLRAEKPAATGGWTLRFTRA